jgi:putative SOS response-associated peptidase YedK
VCGRYALYTETEQWPEAGIGWPLEDGFQWQPSYNVAPGTSAPVVVNLERPVVATHVWGLVPYWAKDAKMGNRLINARAETVAEKPAFRAAIRRRRCLVLADGFYEWRRQGRQKTPHFIRRRSRGLLTLAGLWESWKKPDGGLLRSFTIITTRPNRLLEPIHDRMPAIVIADAHRLWLHPEPRDPASLAELLVPFPEDELEAYEVSKLVNSPANDSSKCIAPV